jgi:hypothetical protein
MRSMGNNRSTALRASLAGLVALLVVQPARAQDFAADSKLSFVSTQVLSNTVATVISTVPTVLYAVQGFNSGSLSPTFVKLFNAGSATCGSGTPFARYVIPASTVAPLTIEITNGIAFGAGITMCVTSGFADSDTTAPATGSYIVNLSYKPQR